MSTKARIGMLNEDGTITSVYCHWDGNIHNVGKILKENYVDSDSVKELLYKGDISTLGKTLDMTKFYDRDYQKIGVEAQTHKSIAQYVWDAKESYVKYIYLFKNNEWVVLVDEELESKF